MIDQILENSLINSLIKNFPRSPLQINKAHESDSEIIMTGEDSNDSLAITTDSIAEEIKSGLYDNPYLIGWMSVMVNISDLAAVGAKPLGLVLSEIIPPNYPQKDLKKLQSGINDACKRCRIFILGGDTNSGNDLIITGTAIGILENNKFILRIGSRPNDILYSTGFLGKGNAFAISRFLNKSELEFFPQARVQQGRIIKDFASACMDTSDGVISTLDQLMRLNKNGFRLNEYWENKIDRKSLELADSFSIPAWLLLAGCHGEFELLFTIPQNLQHEFLLKAKEINWDPVELGSVIKETKIEIPVYNKITEIDSTKIRNLTYSLDKGIEFYLKSLLAMDEKIRSIKFDE
jgi:thiamine-monophosphate kinase